MKFHSRLLSRKSYGIRWFILTTVLLVPLAAAPQYSDLFGNNGSLWKRPGRLPDFSFAGYARGEKAIPNLPVKASVKDFGAKGDGIADDTKAFKDAIASVDSGTIRIPAGLYKITDFIYIRKSNLVLRGAGSDSTVLVFPKGLNEILPKVGHTATGELTTAYSFDYAFLTIQGDFQGQTLADIASVAKRGDSTIEVSTTTGIALKQTITIRVQEDTNHTLKKYLYAGDPGDIAKGKMLDTWMMAKVVSITGKRIRLDRSLRFETRAEWSPEVRSFNPTVTGSGIENIALEFPAVPYPGHFKEVGFNAIEFRQAAHCWARNIRLQNADMGVLFASACFNTANNITIAAYAGRGELHGHHAFQFKSSQDNLVDTFDIKAKYVHDLSVEHAAGNVYSNGKGLDLCFDHHKDTPYENLYSNIHCGAGTRVWLSSGGPSLGRHAAAWSTFWNIRADRKFGMPDTSFSPDFINVIGASTNTSPNLDPKGKWIEPIPPEELAPPELRIEQLSLRLFGPASIFNFQNDKGAGNWKGPVLEVRGNGIYLRTLNYQSRPNTSFLDLQGRLLP